MKKKYLISALVTGVIVFDFYTVKYFESQASAENREKDSSKLPEEKKYDTDVGKKIHNIRMLMAKSNSQSDQNSEKFETVVRDFYYSLQLGVFREKETAEKFLQKLPVEIRQDSFIYESENGLFSVRYGLFDDYNVLEKIQEDFPVSSVIVKTNASRILKTEIKTSEKKDRTKPKKTDIKIEARKEEKPAEKEELKIVPEFEEEEISLFEEEKPQIPLYKKIIGAVFMVPVYMFTHKKRGFWGKIEFSYQTESYKGRDIDTSRDSFRQYYELNYEGFVYSTRLLTYRIGLNYTQVDSTAKSGGSSIDTKSKLTGYRLEMDFLQSTKFPFSLFFLKTQSPLWYTYYGTTTYTERTKNSYGFYGRIGLNTANIAYSLKHTNSQSVNIDFFEDRKTRNYSLSFNKNLGRNRGYLNFSYNKDIDDYVQNYYNLDVVRKVYQDIDRITLKHNLNQKDKNLRNEVRYYSNTYSDIKMLTASSSLQWKVSEKLNTGVSLSGSYSKSRSNELKSFTLSESLSYRITKNLGLSQNFTGYTSSGSNFKQHIVNSGLGLNYSKSLSDYTSFYTGGSFSFQVESGNYSRVGGTINLNSGLTRRFDFLNASFNLYTTAYQYRSSKKDDSKSFSIGERLSFSITSKIRFNHSASYYYMDSKYAVLSSPGEFRYTNYRNTEVSNSISYWTNLGWKGKLSSEIGFRYYTTKDWERTYPYGSLNVTYMIFRNLLYKLNADVYRDTYYSTTNARARTSVDYRFRSFFINFNFNYFYENSDIYGERKNYIAEFKIYRKF